MKIGQLELVMVDLCKNDSKINSFSCLRKESKRLKRDEELSRTIDIISFDGIWFPKNIYIFIKYA